jgi:hypothetical protein
MALYPLQPGMHPLGQFDVVDADLATIAGGEVMTLTTASRTNTSSETASADALDGYTYSDSLLRPASTLASSASEFPLYLADDGNSPDYLTYFGSLTGPVGLGGSESGTRLGPHTASGSGKITLWDKPGLFAVTLSACAADFVSTIPVVVGLAPGAVLGFGDSADEGKLCHAACSNLVANSGVGRFVEFSAEPGLVTTPHRLVGANENFTRLVMQWDAGLGVRTT